MASRVVAEDSPPYGELSAQQDSTTALRPDLEGEKEQVEATSKEMAAHDLKLHPASTECFHANEYGTCHSSDDYESESSRDQRVEVRMTWRRAFAFVAMAFLWVGGQIPLYLYGSIPVNIYADIGGADHFVWFIIAYLLASAATMPFVGAFTDLIGRRHVAAAGCGLMIAGQLLAGHAPNMGTFIAGMAVSGVAAGIIELTALAATSELVPTRRRGYAIAGLMLAITVYMPSSLYAQLIAAAGRGAWRYVAVVCGGWTLAGLVLLLAAYHPPPRQENQRRVEARRRGRGTLAPGLELGDAHPSRRSSTHRGQGAARSQASVETSTTLPRHSASLQWPDAAARQRPSGRGRAQPLTRAEILRAVDWTGGLLCVAGVTLVVVALVLGGYPYSWRSPQVLAPLLAGLAAIALFLLWEYAHRGPSNAMILNARFRHGPLRSLLLTMLVTFVSGAQFFSLLMIWPSQARNVYGHAPVPLGLRGLPFGVGVLAGCVAGLLLLSRLRRGANWLLVGASCVMTAGCGAMAAARRDNLAAVCGLLAVAGLGVGGIVIPAAVMSQAMVPADLIATVTALSMSVRILGGAVGYALYFNLLAPRARRLVVELVPAACVANGVTDPALIGAIARLTGASLVGEPLRAIVAGVPGAREGAYEAILRAGQEAWAGAYPIVYYASIAFGGVAVVASLLMHDINEQLESDAVAVVME